ncbi:hypothetical protein Goshw_017845 [Gossypium schwendimanii]|uniref:non-specific serine/threonine protein kinase n=1 Tax=Gossypium schwendimanii TaxID=34291 RepID=A0A7J9LWN3_GOSSC|nr:hypothetical protein [Gossypium schwendimanii]
MATSLTTDKSKVIRTWILCVPNFVCWYYRSCLFPSIFLLLPLFLSSSPLTFCVASTLPHASGTDPPTPSFKTTQPEPHSHPQIDILITVSLVLVLALLFAMGFLFRFLKLRKLRRSKPTSAAQPEETESKGKDSVGGGEGFVRKFSWDEIKNVTKDFSLVIGQGGFSNVYLANLSGNSRQGAVKVHIGGDRLNQVFKQELDILLRLRHDNIVKLLGYCNDLGALQEGAMVFEYIPNGNLQEKLHERNNEVLPWKTRTAIAYQLAQAIEYLHEKCTLQIIHGDIKASNILLDERFNCKLCDFGSAKMGFSSTVMPPSCSRTTKQVMIGSPGYTDPHYLRTGLASKKNDVYSLGVIILELVTGMEAFCPERGQLLTSIMAPNLKAISEVGTAVEVAELVDPRLGGEFDLDEAKAMISIAGLCLHQSPTVRPSASQIMQIMKEKMGSIDLLLSPAKDCRHK